MLCLFYFISFVLGEYQSFIAKKNVKYFINFEHKVFDFETSSNLEHFLPTNVVALSMYMYTSQQVVQGGGLDKELF